MPTTIIATCFALVAFSASVIGGLAVDNPALTILSRALGSMIACYILGVLIGTVAQRAIDEHIAQYKKKNPLVTADMLVAADDGGASTAPHPAAERPGGT